jgi:hypothetical protein
MWLVSGFGQMHIEFGWRWLSAICGVLTVIGIWRAALKFADVWPALALTLAALTLPALVFYSQEARAFIFLAALAAISMARFFTMLRPTVTPWTHWFQWAALSVVGLQLGYSYVMVLGVQALFLVWKKYHARAGWVSFSGIFLGGLLVTPFALISLGAVANVYLQATPLTLDRTLQTLFAGEAIRYGLTIAHTLWPWLAFFLSLAGLAKLSRTRDVRLLYVVGQVVLPLVAFFGIVGPVFRIVLPLPEAKQFIVLLPAAFVLLAAGADELSRRLLRPTYLKALFAVALGAACLLLNWLGLTRYWETPKSLDSALFKRVVQRFDPPGPFVNLHYRFNFETNFYGSDQLAYINPAVIDGDYRFKRVKVPYFFEQQAAQPIATHPLAEIRAHKQFWVFAHKTEFREAFEPLVAGCQIVEQITMTPFDATLVECP